MARFLRFDKETCQALAGFDNGGHGKIWQDLARLGKI